MTLATQTKAGPARKTGSALAWLYFTPAIVSLLIWVYGPLLFTAVLSFLDWNLVSPDAAWQGLRNYGTLVTQPEFGNAAWNTVLYGLCVLPFATVVPCALAIAMWKRPGRASEIYRMLLFLPVVVAPVANALAWQFILDPLHGAVNQTLRAVGLPAVNWLGDPHTALLTIVAVTVPKVVALNTLLFGAALANVDRRTVEAARMDDAREGEITRAVVIPQLRRTMILLGMLSLVVVWPWLFTNISVLTRGGPSNATDNVYFRLYTYAFTFFDAGTASAAAIVIAVAFGLLLAGYAFLSRRFRASR
ncbi:carbohydrate ABC transporter permease [Amycolatopsis sp. GM8]|uniref:carbohydrate ABC transporter permease n=1 Tax=Amycolatopsis sp. GM8 TaxID=2896530 RepID=UPI001F275DC5|nr:sugar ABC transporter permease [Amycolatopsis sp. GM8]